MNITDYEYKIIDDNVKTSSPIDLKNDTFIIIEKSIKQCGMSLSALGDYPGVKKVRKVIELHDFNDPLEIKDVLLERYLNHKKTGCTYGTRLAALFCVAYNYVSDDLTDEEQMPLIWEAVERADRKITNEFGEQLSPHYIDNLVSMAAEKNEAYILSKLMNIDYNEAKEIVEEDDNKARAYQNLKRNISQFVQEEIESWVDDLADHFEFKLTQEINKIRNELDLPPLEDEEDIEEIKERKDETLELYKTKAINENNQHQR